MGQCNVAAAERWVSPRDPPAVHRFHPIPIPDRFRGLGIDVLEIFAGW
jgi:hypothetical protein